MKLTNVMQICIKKNHVLWKKIKNTFCVCVFSVTQKFSFLTWKHNEACFQLNYLMQHEKWTLDKGIHFLNIFIWKEQLLTKHYEITSQLFTQFLWKNNNLREKEKCFYWQWNRYQRSDNFDGLGNFGDILGDKSFNWLAKILKLYQH